MKYAEAFVIFVRGLGTLDELFARGRVPLHRERRRRLGRGDAATPAEPRKADAQ